MPEPFLSICPHCRAKLKLKDPALIGRVAKCPACQEKFTVSKAAAVAKTAPAGSTSQAKKGAPATKATAAGNPAPAGKAPPKTTAAAAARPAAKPRTKPQAAPAADDETDPWMSDDLSGFDDTVDTAVASGKTAVPPPVRGVSKKRKPTGEASSKRRRKHSAGAGQVAWIGWLVGGGVAGAIGASVWAAIAAFTFSEWGILAWALGGFVGFGVRIGARDEDVGIAPGLTALGIAVVAVILGKFLAVHFMLAGLEKMVQGVAEQGGQVEQVERTEAETVDLIISDFADEIESEWEDQGRTWNEPDYDTIPDDAPWEAWYDPVIWAEAKQRWEALSPEDQTKMIVEYETGEFEFDGDFGELERDMFAASFGLLDVLFFFLAAGTAFKVGSGLDFGDD
jgi:hypothetical protein